MNIYELLLWLGGIQGLLLAFLLFTHKSNQPANLFLGIGCLTLSLELIFINIGNINLYKDYPHLIGIPFSLAFLYGPVFHLYVKLLSEKKNNFDKKNLLHFIPFVLSFIYYLPNYFISGIDKIHLMTLMENRELFDMNLINDAKAIHGTLYMIIVIAQVRIHNNRIKNSFSNIDKINLVWLRYFGLAVVFMIFIVILEHIFEFIYNEKFLLDEILFISIAVLIYSIGYFGLKQPEIFSQKNDDESEKEVEEEKYKKSGLAEETANKYLKDLENLMISNKPYLESNLTLQQLSNELNISTHNLSEVINSKLNQNYYDFVNSYRVEEFKKKLKEKDAQNYTILSLAFDCGFKSKSTFNTIFKKFTGQTPTEYKNSLK